MAELASFALKKRNPDVLTCIANLSNDEVFTPPEFAKQILDTLEKAWADANDGASIWSDSKLRFLDPCTKSGVFLREIVERLTQGLEDKIPDLQTRVDHILTKQVFGIGITHLTSLLARRSVYCSKFANGEHSVASSFGNTDGNIRFESVKHTWVGGTRSVETADEKGNPILKIINGRCKYCGASQSSLERSIESETHAYSFIHNDDIQEFIAETYGEEMQFDVIIGNPPYQLEDGGFGASASAIYNKFVEQAKKLDPRYLTMVIPARWYAGGKGLDEFRAEMLNDIRIRQLHDFPDSSSVFPGIQIKGGVCYFIWERDNPGLCEIVSHNSEIKPSSMARSLLLPGAEVFIRYNEAVPILTKIMNLENESVDSFKLKEGNKFASMVSSSKPFGLRTSFQGSKSKGRNFLKLFQNGGIGYVSRDYIEKGKEAIDSWKIFISAAYGGVNTFPHPVLGKPFIGEPGSICTETYLYIGPFASQHEALNALSYVKTKFFRFLVLLHKPAQHATRQVYEFVPIQDFEQEWTDEKLYKKYGISEDEISFIDSMIRPMEIDSE